MSDPIPSSPRSGATPLLKTIGLTKRYGAFLANDNIDIDIWPQQIHALLGENGAGKSTLVKTIYGLIQPSEGEMRWDGEPMVLSGPSEARARGIGMVFQHFSLFENLTVAENVALGLDGRESFKDVSARLAQLSNLYGLPLDPRREVWQLSVGERQHLADARLMHDGTILRAKAQADTRDEHERPQHTGHCDNRHEHAAAVERELGRLGGLRRSGIGLHSLKGSSLKLEMLSQWEIVGPANWTLVGRMGRMGRMCRMAVCLTLETRRRAGEWDRAREQLHG